MRRPLVPVIVFVGLVVAVGGSLGAPLITAVAQHYRVSLAAAQWTLTIAFLAGAVATPVLGRLGSGPRRRTVVLGTLGVVVAGSVLTVLPLPFWVLLVGRAAQGVGLGLIALMMATARDHLPPERATRTIAVLSVASTAGIGVGYPLAGLLTDLGGIRAAYALGIVITALALVSAAWVLPVAPARPARPVDVPGVVLLTIALLVLLLLISQVAVWRTHPLLGVLGLVVALVLLAGWAWLETRVAHPLVDVRLLRHRAVASADLVMLTGGVAMYLLFGLITRYVQTPAQAGYGFGLDTFQAGLVLVPFSLLGFVAGRLAPRVRVGGLGLLALGMSVVLVACLLFALARDSLALPVIAMGVLGFGVGGFSAAMPTVILAVTPSAETASAMSVNAVVRSVGFSIGSALGGLILAGFTDAVLPRPEGYTVAAWTGVGVSALTLVIIAAVRAPSAAPARLDSVSRSRR